MSFSQPVDIANRAIQHVGATRIVTLADDSKAAAEISQCYDGLRQAELRRNVWTFAVRRAVLYPINGPIAGQNPVQSVPSPPQTITAALPSMLLVPETWSPTESYDFGTIVQDSTGTFWVSTAQSNVNQVPGAAGVTAWESYFGSEVVQPYDPTVNYFIGDLVYQSLGDNQINVYVSLFTGNSSNPSTPTPWSATTTYAQGDVVQDAQGYFWQSTNSLNTGNQPGVYGAWSVSPTYTIGALVIGSDNVLYQAIISTTNVNPANGASPTDWLALGFPGSWPMWNANTTYAKGDIIAGTDGTLYQSVQGSNTGNQPVGSTYNPNTPLTNWWSGLRLPNPWIANVGASTANQNWLGLDATLLPLNINWPVGTGPSIQTETRNIFRLPKGYLRVAPQEPKQGSNSFLGSVTGLAYTDWEYDGEYIISRTPFPIVFRFVANITQVHKMDAMFCEGLGARIGFETCETITQSVTKLGAISKAYKTFIDEARTVNGIEQGPTEPPVDDYLSCRI